MEKHRWMGFEPGFPMMQARGSVGNAGKPTQCHLPLRAVPFCSTTICFALLNPQTCCLVVVERTYSTCGYSVHLYYHHIVHRPITCLVVFLMPFAQSRQRPRLPSWQRLVMSLLCHCDHAMWCHSRSFGDPVGPVKLWGTEMHILACLATPCCCFF